MASAQWTIGKKLYTGVAALMALLIIAGGTTYWVSSSMKDELDTASQVTAKKLEYAMQAMFDAAQVRSEQRRLLLAGFGNDKKLFEQTKAAIAKTLEEARKDLDVIAPLLKTEAGKKLVADMKNTCTQWEAANHEVENLIDKGKLVEAWDEAKAKSNPLVDKFDADVNSLVKQQQEFLKSAEADANAQYSKTIWIVFALLGFSLGLGGVVIYSVRSITRELTTTAVSLGQGAEQVVSAAGQVSSSAQSLSQGATEQSASLEETSASMEEMASMTRKNAENSQNAAKLMSDVDTKVRESNSALGDMVTSMAAIQESSQKVSKIIKTIDEIAFQTNILALNAAVEAARAGEAGMGFAVVADEVRNLAQRSAQAAKDTASLIEESITRAQSGSHKVEQVAGSITAITESVGEVKGLVDEVSQASRQQAQGIDQVTQAIAQMEKVTQATAASAEESAAASEELNAQAEQTMSVVRQLEQMVGSHGVEQAATSTIRHHNIAKPQTGMASIKPRILKMTGARAPEPGPSPEDVLPLGDTGTYGKF